MSKLKRVVFEIDKALIFVSFAVCLIDANIFIQIFLSMDALVLKLFSLFQIYVFFNEAMWVLVRAWELLPKIVLEVPKKNICNTHVIDGIDTNSLVEYMFDSGKLAYEDLKKMFGLSPQKYKKLGSNLEKIGLLKRGENNARILKQGLDKFQVLKHLVQFTNSDDTTPLLHRSGQSARVA